MQLFSADAVHYLKKCPQKVEKTTLKSCSEILNLFLKFSCMFLNPNIFSYLNSNCSNLLDMRNLQAPGASYFKKHSVTKNCPDFALFE